MSVQIQEQHHHEKQQSNDKQQLSYLTNPDSNLKIKKNSLSLSTSSLPIIDGKIEWNDFLSTSVEALNLNDQVQDVCHTSSPWSSSVISVPPKSPVIPNEDNEYWPPKIQRSVSHSFKEKDTERLVFLEKSIPSMYDSLSCNFSSTSHESNQDVSFEQNSLLNEKNHKNQVVGYKMKKFLEVDSYSFNDSFKSSDATLSCSQSFSSWSPLSVQSSQNLNTPQTSNINNSTSFTSPTSIPENVSFSTNQNNFQSSKSPKLYDTPISYVQNQKLNGNIRPRSISSIADYNSQQKETIISSSFDFYSPIKPRSNSDVAITPNNNEINYKQPSIMISQSHYRDFNNNMMIKPGSGMSSEIMGLDKAMYYEIEFKRFRKDIFIGTINFGVGDYVKVEADRGYDLGHIVAVSENLNCLRLKMKNNGVSGIDKRMKDPLKVIQGLATPFELNLLRRKFIEECGVLEICRNKVEQRNLPMIVIDAEFQFDRHKLTFYFEAEKRIDFRDLVRDLFSIYKTRIWMQQVSLESPNNNDNNQN